MRAKPTEQNIQLEVIRYIKLQYPKVIAVSDLSGVKLTGRQAVTAALGKTHTKIPDLTIYHESCGFGGLLIEFKRSDQELFITSEKRKLEGLGKWKSQHVADQYAMLISLCAQNFAAVFCTSFEDAKMTIDLYIKNPAKFAELFHEKHNFYVNLCD